MGGVSVGCTLAEQFPGWTQPFCCFSRTVLISSLIPLTFLNMPPTPLAAGANSDITLADLRGQGKQARHPLAISQDTWQEVRGRWGRVGQLVTPKGGINYTVGVSDLLSNHKPPVPPAGRAPLPNRARHQRNDASQGQRGGRFVLGTGCGADWALLAAAQLQGPTGSCIARASVLLRRARWQMRRTLPNRAPGLTAGASSPLAVMDPWVILQYLTAGGWSVP